jgi:hypothetical protein
MTNSRRPTPHARRTRRALALIAATGVTAVAMMACNALLGIQDGRPAGGDAGADDRELADKRPIGEGTGDGPNPLGDSPYVRCGSGECSNSFSSCCVPLSGASYCVGAQIPCEEAGGLPFECASSAQCPYIRYGTSYCCLGTKAITCAEDPCGGNVICDEPGSLTDACPSGQCGDQPVARLTGLYYCLVGTSE